MNTLELLKKAIELQKPISFKYNKEGKIAGERIGNTHAVFIFTKKSGDQDTKVHIVQTGGVSDTEPNNFPEFRMFNILELSDIEVLENKEKFTINEKYNPEWDGYENVIAKI